MYTAIPGCPTRIGCTCETFAIFTPSSTCVMLEMSVFSISLIFLPIIFFLFHSSVESAVLHKRPFNQLYPLLNVSAGDLSVDVAVAPPPELSPSPAGASTSPPLLSTPLYGASPLPLPASPTNGIIATPVPGASDASSSISAAGTGDPTSDGPLTSTPSITPAPGAPGCASRYSPCNVFFQVNMH